LQRSRRRGAQTALPTDYSKLKVQNPLKIPKKISDLPSHPRMKKLLLVATVLVGGVAISQAGININIGFGLPHHRPAIVIRQPATYCPPPVYVAPPVCPPRVVVPCPPVYYQPVYEQHQHRRGHGQDRWNRPDRGRNHWR
jgi:hypothetical protein